MMQIKAIDNFGLATHTTDRKWPDSLKWHPIKKRTSPTDSKYRKHAKNTYWAIKSSKSMIRVWFNLKWLKPESVKWTPIMNELHR